MCLGIVPRCFIHLIHYGDTKMNTETTDNKVYDLSRPIRNTIKAYGRGYFGRPAGSYIQKDGKDINPVDMLQTLEWTEVLDTKGFQYGTCRYFKATIPEGYVGYKGAVSIDEYAVVRNDKGLPFDLIFNPKGLGGDAKHQHEILSTHISPVRTDEVWIIIGNADNPMETFELADGSAFTSHAGPVYSRETTVIKLLRVD